MKFETELRPVTEQAGELKAKCKIYSSIDTNEVLRILAMLDCICNRFLEIPPRAEKDSHQVSLVYCLKQIIDVVRDDALDEIAEELIKGDDSDVKY